MISLAIIMITGKYLILLFRKEDGHNTSKNSGQNNKKETPYLYERNNQYNNQNKGYDQYSQNNDNSKNEKTSVKVHNPPGGKTNFTFG